MSRDLVIAPATRSWRDIPQPVKPRTMSRGGQWRLVAASLRAIGVAAVVAGLAASVWMVASALQENPKSVPAADRSVPIKPPELTTDGMLDGDWLARTLHLPKGANLLGLDLMQLRSRLLADGQVLTANLALKFPDKLVVKITERTPIARVLVEWAGVQRPLFVARDGVVFDGLGYSEAIIKTLPWLDGVAIVRSGAGYRPIPGMDAVSELLAKATLEADHLYRTWHVVSLTRLQSDGEIEVRTRAPQEVKIIFSSTDDYFRQLARLDYIWERLPSLPELRARIDLSLGRDVPITIEKPAAVERQKAGAKPATATTFSVFRSWQTKI